jgi:predicted  nucleic acid-binding Zn-ribbon protein
MHADLEKLLELQQTDAEISRLNQEIGALPKRVAEIETELAAHLADVDKAKAAAKGNEQNRRKYEGEIQTLQQKISKYRDQMLAVKTNDEYRALWNEIKFAEEAIRGFEDRILESMIQSEDLDNNIKAAEKALAIERAEVEQEKKEARDRTAEDESALKQLLPRRASLREGIDEMTLRHYDRVLKSRGSALAEVRDQICMACHVMLRPQVYNEVRAGEKLLSCDSCGRILYFEPVIEITPETMAPDPPKETPVAEHQGEDATNEPGS